MRRILLANAPFYDLYGASRVAVSYYFPLGIGYIASLLEKHGYAVELLTESKTIDVFKAVRQKLTDGQYLLVGISSMTTSFPGAVRLARCAKEVAPGTPVVVGGPHVTGMADSALQEQPELDFLGIGEGELTVLQLAQALEAGRTDFADVQGLVWRSADGQVVANPLRPFHTNLDELGHPARHLVDFSEFSIHSHVYAGKGRGASVVTSRGCPFGCIFCSAHLTHGRRMRYHSLDFVMKELHLLRDRYGVKYVWFQDDTLTVNRRRVMELCERIQNAQLDMNFGCFSRVDVFDDEMARVLSAAGFRMVTFGIESGVPEILKKIGKSADLDQARQAIDNCRKHRIRAIASFVVGFPFESPEDLRKTFRFGRGLDASILMFNPLVPFPGSKVFDPVAHKPKTVDGWARFLTTEAPPFDMIPGIPARKLKALVEREHVKYYMHPRRIVRSLREMSSPAEVWQSARAFLGVLSRALRQ